MRELISCLRVCSNDESPIPRWIVSESRINSETLFTYCSSVILLGNTVILVIQRLYSSVGHVADMHAGDSKHACTCFCERREENQPRNNKWPCCACMHACMKYHQCNLVLCLPTEIWLCSPQKKPELFYCLSRRNDRYSVQGSGCNREWHCCACRSMMCLILGMMRSAEI
jgi:hypothetical protein